jgi:hypothetical protein
MNRPLREGAAVQTGVVRDGAYSTTACLVQLSLFGLAARADYRTTVCAPCPRCGTAAGTIGPGSGPHHAELRCLRGHFLKSLPKPGGAA